MNAFTDLLLPCLGVAMRRPGLDSLQHKCSKNETFKSKLFGVLVANNVIV